MNRVERLQAVLAGQPVDRPPYSFWIHMGLQHMPGEALAAAQLAFARRFEPDFLKVPSDYPYPMAEGFSIDRPTDWSSLVVLNGNEGGWGQQLQALQLLVKGLKGRTWVLDTLPSPWATLCRLGTRALVVQTAREAPGLLRHALGVVATSQARYVQRALALGVQGFCFEVSEASADRMTPGEYAALCRPYDLQVLEAAREAPFNVLHLQGRRTYLEGLLDYPVAALSCSHLQSGPALARGLVQGGRPILGGLEGETLPQQTPGGLRAWFEQRCRGLWLPGLILTPGSALPSDISPHLLEAVKAGIERLAFLKPREPVTSEQLLAEALSEESRIRVERDEELPRAPHRAGPVAGERHPAPPPRPEPRRPRHPEPRPWAREPLNGPREEPGRRRDQAPLPRSGTGRSLPPARLHRREEPRPERRRPLDPEAPPARQEPARPQPPPRSVPASAADPQGHPQTARAPPAAAPPRRGLSRGAPDPGPPGQAAPPRADRARTMTTEAAA